MGGRAGQGINLISKIVSNVLVSYGYFTFNYRDYQSLIRGGHNFNVLSISDSPIQSHESKIDVIVALDDRTLKEHEKEIRPDTIKVTSENFESEGRNINVALAGALLKILGVPITELEKQIKQSTKIDDAALVSAKKGYDSQEAKLSLEKLDNKISILSGSKAIADGARSVGLDLYIAYPMTPATNALHEMATNQVENKMMVFQAENEISVASMALGASFAGAKTLIGTSGGGFDLMSESLSLQGISGIPLTVYLAARPGPGTGVPTYVAQSDLDIALRAGHGEFPRIVVAPGNAVETIEKTAEALYLSEKFKILSVILSDKHIAESEFSSTREPATPKEYKVERNLPGSSITKASSYETNELGNSTERADLVKKNIEERHEKYTNAKEFINQNLEMVKIHGNQDSQNLIIGWGSPSGVIIDAIKDMDAKFLQVMYLKPMSPKVKEEIQKAKYVILVECNSTGQLGRLIREKTGIKIEDRILKYDARPFRSDELRKQLEERLR